MAHARKKRRTQTPGNLPTKPGEAKLPPGSRIPKSMVIRMGASNVGPSVTQLVHDTRQVMEPHTASRLKERRSNKLRDYTTMAGPLGVSHFLLFSRGKDSGNVNLRLGITPRGPTLGFRIEQYSLCRDIIKSQKHPKAGAISGGGITHTAPPLLVMNNFSTPGATAASKVPKHLESLLTSTFQSLFPPIAPQATPLSAIRRVLLLNRETDPEDDGAYIVNLRHYAISTRVLHQGLSRGLKRLQRAEKHATAGQRKAQFSASKPDATTNDTSANATSGTAGPKRKTKGQLPNMGRLDDVADYLLEGGYTSASETEIETDAEVEVFEPAARKVLNRKDRQRQAATREAQEAEAEAERGQGDGGDDEGNGEEQDEEAHAAKKAKRAPPVQKRAIKLTELGPRMKLRLLKVEEGLCEGKVMWHEFIEKSAAEEQEMEEVWDQRRTEKEERRRVQRENLLAKRKTKSGGRGNDDKEEEDAEDDDMDDDEWNEEMDDVAEDGEDQ